jgi:hypothetical protein
MENNKITSLQDLEKEKKRLELRMEICKRELVQSAGFAKGEVKSFLFKKVAIPMGLVGLSAYGLKSMTNNNTAEAKVNGTEKKQHFLMQLLPLAISFLQTYLEKEAEVNH